VIYPHFHFDSPLFYKCCFVDLNTFGNKNFLKRHKVTTDKLGNTIPEEDFDELADKLFEAQKEYK